MAPRPPWPIRFMHEPVAWNLLIDAETLRVAVEVGRAAGYEGLLLVRWDGPTTQPQPVLWPARMGQTVWIDSGVPVMPVAWRSKGDA